MLIQRIHMQVLNQLQECLGRHCPFFFITPHERTIGNTAEEIHYGLQYVRRHGKKLVILRRFQIFGAPIICNAEIFRISSPFIASGFIGELVRMLGCLYISIFFGWIPASITYLRANLKNSICNFYHRACHLITRNPKYNQPWRHLYFKFCFFHLEIGIENLWNPDPVIRHNSDFSWETLNRVNWRKDIEDYIPVYLRESSAKPCEEQFYRMGPKPGDWFVCVHCREAGFHKDSSDRRNNVSIETYFPAIQEIVKKGGWVIRLGDSSMTPLPKMEKVIDYPFSEFKSPVMDIYLIQNCRFYFGQNSGIMDVAYLLQKKSVIVNSTEWGISFVRNKDSISLIKHYFSHEKGRYLSINELLDEPFHSQDLTLFESKNHFKNNSSEEIRDAVLECMNQDTNYEFTARQKEFLRRREIQIHRWIDGLKNASFDKDHNRLLQYRIACRANSMQGSLARNFLEKNWEKNSLNES